MLELNRVHHGDNLALMRQMPDNCIDAVVTDPPYGLSFMGKRWDYDVPSVEQWAEVLRVLKPGGHLLSFAGTRTQHRMAVNIEDAGFEIRDLVMWVYGCLSDDSEVLTRDGWERYHTARHKEILAYDPQADVYQWERPSRWSEYRVESDTAYRIESDHTEQIVSRGHRCLVERGGVLAFVPADELAGVERVPYLQGDVSALPQGRGELLLEAVLRQGEGLAETARRKRQWQEVSGQGDGWGEESGVEGRTDVLQAEGQVRRPVDQVRSLPGSVHGHGTKGWLRHGAPAGGGDGDGAVAVAERVCASRQPRRDGQPAREPDAVRDERGSQAIRTRPSYRTTLATVTPIEYTGLIFCPTVSTGAFVARRNGKVFVTGNSGFPKSHNGPWGGTALKPAVEPITLARKPLDGTVAENVQQWGTGGLDIDGCRVGFTGPEDKAAAAAAAAQRSCQDQNKNRTAYGHFSNGPASLQPYLQNMDKGRWPANFIHDGSDEVVGLFPVTAKGTASGYNHEESNNHNTTHIIRNIKSGVHFGDSGSAARFFYVPKPSSGERDEGCEGLEEVFTMRYGEKAQGPLPQQTPSKPVAQRNHHPTVKPVELMEYLVRLISREGQIVLDPWGGSGTTGVACKILKRQFILMEREAEYVRIAEARIGAKRQMKLL